MVREFGLSPELGPVGYPEGGSVFLGGGGGQGLSSRPFAESTQAIIDREVARLLREAEVKAVDLIRSHRGELLQLVDLLLERETVDGAEVYRIIGKPAPEHRAPSELVLAPHGAGVTGAVAPGSRARTARPPGSSS
jgi:cell division protease FtsH